jgi:sulfatase maturation enzyme AslB (radical SAM superfamily)
MQRPTHTLHEHKSSLGQRFRKIKEFLTTDHSIDWASLWHKVTGQLTSNAINQDSHRTRRWSIFLNNIKPLWFAQAIRNILILFIVVILIYSFLAIERLPKFSDVTQPVRIDHIQDIQKAAKLFGYKNTDMSKVKLTGLMRHDGSSDGYAVFEVAGKNTGAIAVGETFDNGYFLKSIGAEGVVVMFQGKLHQILMVTKGF